MRLIYATSCLVLLGGCSAFFDSGGLMGGADSGSDTGTPMDSGMPTDTGPDADAGTTDSGPPDGGMPLDRLCDAGTVSKGVDYRAGDYQTTISTAITAAGSGGPTVFLGLLDRTAGPTLEPSRLADPTMTGDPVPLGADILSTFGAAPVPALAFDMQRSTDPEELAFALVGSRTTTGSMGFSVGIRQAGGVLRGATIGGSTPSASEGRGRVMVTGTGGVRGRQIWRDFPTTGTPFYGSLPVDETSAGYEMRDTPGLVDDDVWGVGTSDRLALISSGRTDPFSLWTGGVATVQNIEGAFPTDPYQTHLTYLGGDRYVITSVDESNAAVSHHQLIDCTFTCPTDGECTAFNCRTDGHEVIDLTLPGASPDSALISAEHIPGIGAAIVVARIYATGEHQLILSFRDREFMPARDASGAVLEPLVISGESGASPKAIDVDAFVDRTATPPRVGIAIGVLGAVPASATLAPRLTVWSADLCPAP
ncbi:MAG: hypothetical protein DRJ42_12665 [Deltaproteobacteria bacterium]|nr:MAG: hypothetical protein DRJ42_12665 [Deltaproteobacteria bacterium]